VGIKQKKNVSLTFSLFDKNISSVPATKQNISDR